MDQKRPTKKGYRTNVYTPAKEGINQRANKEVEGDPEGVSVNGTT